MTSDRLGDFVSAGAFPRKLLFAVPQIRRHTELSNKSATIVPYHLQFSPTNRCNSKCAWCSCANVDRDAEMTAEDVKAMLDHFGGLGTQAVTLTGGGEPTLHPDLAQILRHCEKTNLATGLVTNGLLWTNLVRRREKIVKEAMEAANDALTWLRLSIVDVASGDYDVDRLKRMSKLVPNVDIGISFTVPKNLHLPTAQAVICAAEGLPNVTHIRFVEEILGGAPEAMNRVEDRCGRFGSKAIFQRRGAFTCGAERCLMSKLKPMVDPQGYVFPCCGVQYADGGTGQTLDMSKKYRMCRWADYSLDTAPFNGSRCVKCYYAPYQSVLEQIEGPSPRHMAFV